jgi:hypothetical protein
MVVRTKAKETLLVALHFKYVDSLLPVSIPISVELVRHNVGDSVSKFWGTSKWLPADV